MEEKKVTPLLMDLEDLGSPEQDEEDEPASIMAEEAQQGTLEE